MFDVITIGPMSAHAISLIAILSTFVIAFYLLTIPLQHRIAVALLLALIGMQTYEFVFILFYSQELSLLYLLVDIGLLAVLSTYNSYFHFVKVRWALLTCIFAVELVMFLYLFFSGWFTETYAWITGEITVDPHNIVWAISKVLWFLMWLTVLKPRHNTHSDEPTLAEKGRAM